MSKGDGKRQSAPAGHLPALHLPVLYTQVMEGLQVKEDGTYLDGTFGRGGHSRLILEQLSRQGRLTVFDKDPQAVEAAQSLAFKRNQIFRLVVLPQCVRRMLPPWMNLYASITMSTSLASLVGVHDVVDTAQIASNTVARTDFTILVYFTLLALFFAYCYPIARATRSLERRHERH